MNLATARKLNGFLSVILIAALLFGSVGIARAVQVGNDTIDFITYRYDFQNLGESTWYYKVVSGTRPSISHVTFELNLDCVNVVDAGTWDGTNLDSLTPGGGMPQLVSPDPTTGITGLKFDRGFNDGETRYYYFTVDRNYARSEVVTVASKGGNDFDTALIEGPSPDCAFYPPNPTPGIDIEKTINDDDADSAPGLAVTEGDALTFLFNITNTGNVDLANVVVEDDVFGSVCTIGTLLAGGTASCSISETAGIGLHTNIASVAGTFLETGAVVTDSDPANYTGSPRFVAAPTIDVEKFVNGSDADDAPGEPVIEGDALVFTYVVTNTGNVPLAGITVVDDVLGLVCNIPSLDPGASDSCTANDTAVLGEQVNVGTAAGWYDDAQVSDSDPAYYTAFPRFIANPIIDIEKYVNGEDADAEPGVALTEGDPVTFAFVVSNTGNVDLSNVDVVDSVFGPVCQVASLAVGESFTCTVSVVAGVGLHFNLGTVTGSYNNTAVSDSDNGYYTAEPRFIPAPAIDIEKLVNGQDADVAPGLVVTQGDLLTFDFIVTNTGNVDLANIAVVDNVLGPVCTLESLAVGASSTCTISGVAALRAQHVNIGTVTAVYDQVTVSDSDPAYYFGKPILPPTPSLKFKKYVNGKDADTAPGIIVKAGSTVTFGYMVMNNGNVTLTNILVADNIIGNICTIPVLEPGQIVTCTATAVAIKGPYMNIGKAGTWYGDPKNGGIKITATDVANYTGE